MNCYITLIRCCSVIIIKHFNTYAFMASATSFHAPTRCWCTDPFPPQPSTLPNNLASLFRTSSIKTISSSFVKDFLSLLPFTFTHTLSLTSFSTLITIALSTSAIILPNKVQPETDDNKTSTMDGSLTRLIKNKLSGAESEIC